MAATVLVAGGGAGAAAACNHPDSTSFAAVRMTTAEHHHHAFAHRWFWLGDTVTGYLGITRDQLKTDLHNGQTLAQVADATPGKSAAGLVAAIVAPWQAKLDAAVTAGKLSSANEATILGNLNTKVTAFVNGQWHWWWWHR